MTFVDVGANWGYFTLLAAARVGAGGRVVALEPDPRVFPLLQENVGLNPVPQVTALPLAAADRPGSVLLEGFDQRGADGLSKLVTEPAGSGTVFSVAARTLDDLLDDIGVRSIHVLKMDIEGGEARALTGLRGYLASGRLDRLLLELHPRDLADVRSSPEDVMDFLRAAGYEGWTIDHSGPATRRAYYARSLDPRRWIRPLDPREPLDSWPHQLWVRRGWEPL